MNNDDRPILLFVAIVFAVCMALAAWHPSPPDSVAHAGKVARSVTVSWNNYGQPPSPNTWRSVLEGSTNGETWYRITNCPWAPSITLDLGPRPPCEIYRSKIEEQ